MTDDARLKALITEHQRHERQQENRAPEAETRFGDDRTSAERADIERLARLGQIGTMHAIATPSEADDIDRLSKVAREG
jgi:hypothetical protein